MEIKNDREIGTDIDPKQKGLQTLDNNLRKLRYLSSQGEIGLYNSASDKIKIQLNFCVEIGLFSENELSEHFKRLSEFSPTSEWYPFGSYELSRT